MYFRKIRQEAQRAEMAVNNIVLKKRLDKRTKSLKRRNKRLRNKSEQNRVLKKQAGMALRELEEIKQSMITVLCPYCEVNNMIAWDESWGLISYCPKCGAQVMLCEYCSKYQAGCDYDDRLDVCSEM